MRTFRSEQGIGKYTFIVFGSIVGAACFYAFNVIPFYYSYYEIQNQMVHAIRVASEVDDKELRRRLQYHVKKQGLPVTLPDDLVIERQDRYMRIRMDYREVFYVSWRGTDYVLQTFDFKARAEGEF